MNVLYFSLFSLFFLLCECKGDSAFVQFEEAQQAGERLTEKVIGDAALEIIDAIETMAERGVQEDSISTGDEVDWYIDAQTVMQSDLVVLLDKLNNVASKMLPGEQKRKIQSIINRYSTLEVEVPGDFIDLCEQAKESLKSFGISR